MKNDAIALGQSVKRGLKIFLKDRATVFFSLLAPLIVLILYILFLGDVQMDALRQSLGDMEIGEDVLAAFVDGWMLSGVMAVACITVSLSANNIMVRDKERGVIGDAYASPVKRGVITASYFVYNFLVTAVICFIVLGIAFVYLAVSGWYLSAADVFGLIGHTLLSVLSATLITVFAAGFLRSESALGAIVGIVSAAIGFLCGAYFPLSMLPKAVQYVVLFVPGTYSAGVFRQLFMSGALAEISAVTAEGAEAIAGNFSMTIDFFGREMQAGTMEIVLAGAILLFLAVNVVFQILSKKNTADR